MKSTPACLTINTHSDDKRAIRFCEEFLQGNKPKFIFGRNEYAESIAQSINIDGFIDDFAKEKSFLGKPIVRIEDVPQNAMVVAVVVLGRPFVAKKRLNEYHLNHLDYFAFQRYAPIPTTPVNFWNEFETDFIIHRDRYDWIYELLQDDESKLTLNKIINFRLSADLECMQGFKDLQYRQYFENFLSLKSKGETFVDVGGFDGYTSLEFIKRCPEYSAIHIFEPEPKNMTIVQENTIGFPGIHLYLCGLANKAQTLRFKSEGSSSKISEEGETEIKVNRLDDILLEPISFMKMDIEGGETEALRGAKQTIIKYHPRLAISAYHRYDDLWKIPELILSFRNDYQIFLRHYTEGITETVMFFIPRS